MLVCKRTTLLTPEMFARGPKCAIACIWDVQIYEGGGLISAIKHINCDTGNQMKIQANLQVANNRLTFQGHLCCGSHPLEYS